MRKVTSILCSIAFMVCGIMMAVTASDPSSNSYKTMSAATLSLSTPAPIAAVPPVDHLIGYERNVSGTTELTNPYVDSLKTRISMLEKKQVTKVKWRKVAVPTPVVMRDTIRETHYYLATQVGNKEGPMGECIPIYEVHKVNEVCPEIIDSALGSTSD